ncbi:COLEC12 [Mytilus edulis]|uniref:COLEC12 n=1 Tax=Mytilus edulis TaxID=6550 RepID=A0A8S3PVS3_MYTED|nr:COLEC12 [Mytilus edulis]
MECTLCMMVFQLILQKYTERVNDAGHYFELKIFNLGESDFGKAFECQYSFLTSNSVTLTRDISHGPLTLSVETSQSNCRTEVKLKCLYFGPTCCTDDARVWSRNGTQIMNNDSLYDLCPSNWTRFADSCYYPSTHGQVHNFHTAATFCNGHSSHLVEIGSPEEQVFMEKLINKTNSLHDFWIGANDIDHEGIWKWNGSNTVLNYSHWCTGEPNNALQGEDCAALNVNNIPGKNFCWNDYSCKSYHNFVCEKSISAVSTTTNTYTLPTGTLVWRTVARK